MRKKSNVTVQKWVDSIAVDEEDKNVLGDEREKQNKQDCDNSELNVEKPSSSREASAGVKGKITEICNKLNVNEKLKSKKVQEFKNLFVKTTEKISKSKTEINMEQHEIEDDKNCVNKEDDEQKNEEDESKIEIEKNKRCHLSMLGRSVSENPRPSLRTRRLTDIGRSFSVAHDNELPTNDLCENLIYDVEDDTSLAIPLSSPSVINNSKLDRNLSALRPPERPLRMHTVSEGHYSPCVLQKNQLLRDCSFQVS